MVHGSKGGHSQTLTSASLLDDAELILLAPCADLHDICDNLSHSRNGSRSLRLTRCGFSLERTHAELGMLPLLQSDAWRTLPAVRRGAVAVSDSTRTPHPTS